MSLFILYVHDHDRLGFGMLTVEIAVLMHQSIETPTPWVPGKGRGFVIDPSQKASISLPS